MCTAGTSTGGGHGPIVSKVEKPEPQLQLCSSISGLVVEYIVAIDVTRVRFPADAWWQHHAALPAADGKSRAGFSLQAATLWPGQQKWARPCGQCESAHPVHHLQVEPLVPFRLM